MSVIHKVLQMFTSAPEADDKGTRQEVLASSKCDRQKALQKQHAAADRLNRAIKNLGALGEAADIL
jgi:hypothetical protein